MKDEKREAKRITRKFVIRVARDNGDPWPSWSLVTTQDISVTGALFTFDQEAKPGDKLFMDIHFGEKIIECKAKVNRIVAGSRKPLLRLAVTFEGLSEADKKHMDDFVKEYKYE